MKQLTPITLNLQDMGGCLKRGLSDCEELSGGYSQGVTERIIASTRNQPVEIVLIFELLISKKLYTATLIITIIPP